MTEDTSAQRWYISEFRRYGMGAWKRRGSVFPSKAHATFYARGQNAIPETDARKGKRELIYRVTEVEKS